MPDNTTPGHEPGKPGRQRAAARPKVELTCSRCGKVYVIFASRRVPVTPYCSRECTRAKVEVAYALFEVKYLVKPSTLEKGQGRYCSKACADKARTTKVEKTCLTCGKSFYAQPSRMARGIALYCSKPCLPQLQSLPVEKRFWDKVEVRGPEDCWEWQRALNQDGYGIIRHGTRMHTAHRVVLMMQGVDLPAGLEVMHACDNRRCVNPAHLRLGTHTENMQDRIVKGRHLLCEYRGEKHADVKLTEQAVRDMRRRFFASGATAVALAEEYGVSHSAALAAIKGQTWKHVT